MAGQNDIWRKRVLLPLWIVQLLGLVVLLGLTALALWFWDRAADDVIDDNPELAGQADELDQAVDTSAAISLTCAAVTILMVFVEMVLFCTHRLAPVANIVVQSIKSAIWTCYLIAIVVAAARGGSAGGVVFLVLVIFVTSIAQLAYGATLVHRKRKGTLRGTRTAPSPAADPSRYEPSRHEQTTGYAAPSSHTNPFRDPSPAPPYNPVGTHPAHRPAGGEAGGYYGPGTYEMQQPVGR